MKKQIILISFLFFFSSLYLSAQKVSFNTNCQLAYHQILSMHLEAADSILKLERRSDIDNAYVPYLNNYVSFVSLFVSQDEKLYRELRLRKAENFEEVENLNDTCRYKKWMLGNMHLQWAVIKIIFEDYISAAIEFNSAYHLIEDNVREFPNFRLNDLSESVLKIILGLVPEQYNWFLSLLSMNGDIEEGKNELSGFLSHIKSDSAYAPYFSEALFYAAFIEMNIHPDQKKLSGFLKETESADEDVTMITFLEINLLMRTGENQKAMVLLQNIKLDRQKTYPFFYLNYLYAECLLRARQWKKSSVEFDLFVMNFEGENYIKDALRKKAWAAFMLQDSSQFLECLQEVKTNGSERIDIDKEAMAEAENEQFPNRQLLLLRILFDGGYYQDAMSLLKAIDTSNYTDDDKVEFIYRSARIYHQLNDMVNAKKYYELTVFKGKNSDAYYAANAALKLGEIYEFESKLILAREAYSTCLNMDYYQYRNSITRRAREGLKRISNNE